MEFHFFRKKFKIVCFTSRLVLIALVIFANKEIYMKRNLFFVILCIPFLLKAQIDSKQSLVKSYHLTGFVIDSTSSEPLPYASLSLLDSDSKKLFTGGICNEKGRFKMESVPIGVYDLLIEYMGYSPKKIQGVHLNDSHIDMGFLHMSKFIDVLDEIELIDEKNYLVQGIDKKVFDVSQDETNIGGSALSILEKLPSLDVDVDGNVSLRGSDQVRLYIDGKSSVQVGADVLESLPSSMIASVELITNPSAKYSPEGMAGIVNIVLKKDKRAGSNGNLGLTLGYPKRNSLTAFLNQRSEKFNIYGSYSMMDHSSSFTSKSEKQTYFSNDTFNLKRDKWGYSERRSHTFKAGVDYSFDEKTSLTLDGKYVPSNRTAMDTVRYHQISVEGFDAYDRLTDSKTSNAQWDVSLSGKKEWTSGLIAEFLLSQSHQLKQKDDVYSELRADFLNEEITKTLEQLADDRLNDQFEFKIDFSFGEEDEGRWEWGLSTRKREMDQDQFSGKDSIYNDISHLDNRFIFEDEVHSLYGNYARAYGLWSFQMGLRGEQVATQSILEQTDSTYQKDYTSFYPSVYLTYQLDEFSSLLLNYSRRVNRPSFRKLNPFPLYADPYNLRMGNPLLNPEFVDSYEIGFQKFTRGTTFTAALFAKDIKDKQRRYISVDSLNVSRVTYQNLNRALDVGIELLWSKKFRKHYDFMLSTTLYHTQMDAGNLTSSYNESTLSMRSNFNFGWKKNGHKLQLSGWIKPGAQVGQGKMETMSSIDLVYSKSVFSESGKLNVKISDLFNTRGFGIDTYGAMFDQSFSYKRQSRMLTLSLSCNFGTNDKNQKSRRRVSRNTPSRDMDGGFF